MKRPAIVRMALSLVAALLLLLMPLMPLAHAEGGFTGSSVIAGAPRPAVAGSQGPGAPASPEPDRGGALWSPFAKGAGPALVSPEPAASAKAPPAASTSSVLDVFVLLIVLAAAGALGRAAWRHG